jgi:signal transduction histidine kinase
MQLLEADRQSVRHPQSQRPDKPTRSKPEGREQSTLPEMLESIAKKTQGKVADDLRRVASRARAVKQTEILDRKKLLDGYTELAAAGQTAALVGRSMSACLDRVQDACATLKKSFGQKSVDEIVRAASALTKLESTVDLAADQLRSVTAVQTAASRRRRGLDVIAELEKLKELSQPLLDEHGAALQIESTSGVFRTEMRPELFVSVMSSLITNALEWRQPSRRLVISIGVRLIGDTVTLHVSDNGRGVTPLLEETLFEPMVSGREEASGMGLTIARSIIEMHGGTMALTVDRRRHGAHFQLALPKKKSRSTVPPPSR